MQAHQNTATGRLRLEQIEHTRGETDNRITVRFLCGDDRRQIQAPASAFRSFVEFRTYVFSETGLWLTVDEAPASDWQRIVAAACQASSKTEETIDAIQ
jgi:hypothetical protein